MKIIAVEKPEEISGGLPGIAVPGLPGIPYVTCPGDSGKDDRKDEDRSGGVTFTW